MLLVNGIVLERGAVQFVVKDGAERYTDVEVNDLAGDHDVEVLLLASRQGGTNSLANLDGDVPDALHSSIFQSSLSHNGEMCGLDGYGAQKGVWRGVSLKKLGMRYFERP